MSIRAAIDVGSNSVKLLVLDIAPDGSYAVLADEATVTGLGKGLGEGGALAPTAMRETLSVIAALTQRARELGAESIRAAGTSALRRAANAGELLAAVQETAGVSIEVISGLEEARLSRAVALRELQAAAANGVADPNIVFFDVGGGSTELTLQRAGAAAVSLSLELGARRCTEEAGIGYPVDQPACDRLLEYIRLKLAAAPHPATFGWGEPVHMAGLGGTASEIVWLRRGQRGEPKGDPHLAEVTRAQTAALFDLLGSLTLAAAQALPNADPRRSEVMYAGCGIILELLRFFGAPRFTLVDRGLRFGLLLADNEIQRY